MNIGEYLSVISIIVAVIFIILKVQFDLFTYKTMKEVMADGDVSPSLVAEEIRVVFLYLVPVLISLVLSIIGTKKKNSYRKLGLTLNILAILYLIVPVGILIAIL